MKKSLLFLLFIVLVFSLSSCQRDSTPPPAQLPTDYVEIPEYVDSPDRIEYWHRQVRSRWVSDEETTGYGDYRFTPVEFILTEIPDVNKPGRVIKKGIYVGDCDDYALWNPYIAYSRLKLEGHVVYILNQGNIHVAHALGYGLDKEAMNCHVWDNQYYRGNWSNIEAYVENNYPNWIIYFHKPLDEYLWELFAQGHLEYAPAKPSRGSTRPKTKNYCTLDGICR